MRSRGDSPAVCGLVIAKDLPTCTRTAQLSTPHYAMSRTRAHPCFTTLDVRKHASFGVS